MSTPPLISLVIPSFYPYGAERTALELAARLPARGFRTRLLVLFDEPRTSRDGDDRSLRGELRARDVRYKLLAGPQKGPRLPLVQALGTALFSDPARTPAIVHTQLFGADAWTMAAALVRFSQKGMPRPKFVSTAQNVDRDDSTFRRFARRWAVRRMDKIAAISEDVARYAREDLGVPGNKITLIPNGIDVSRLIPRGDRAFRGTPKLLMVGRLEPQKGHETAFRALASVHVPWSLDVAGEGSLARDLKELAEKLGIASRVHFLGARSDIPQLLAQTDLLLFPSKWEGFGIALAEAAAAGVPLLASDLPALRDFIPSTRLVPPGDVHAWQRAISETLEDPSSALATAAHLAPRIRKRYDVEAMVDRYAEFYREVLMHR